MNKPQTVAWFSNYFALKKAWNHDASQNTEEPWRYAKGNTSGAEGKLHFGFSYTRHSTLANGKQNAGPERTKEGREVWTAAVPYSVMTEWPKLRRVRRRGLVWVGVASLEEVHHWGWALRLQTQGRLSGSLFLLPVNVDVAPSVAPPEPCLLLCGHAPQPWWQ